MKLSEIMGGGMGDEESPVSESKGAGDSSADQMRAFKRALDDGKFQLAYSLFEGLVAECEGPGDEAETDYEG